MSDLTGLGTESNERPHEGLPRHVTIGENSPVDARVSGSESEEGEVKDDHPVSTKRQRSLSIEEQYSVEEQPSPKRIKPTKDSSFNLLRNPADRIPCVVRIDESEPFGTLYSKRYDFAAMLFIDAGRYGPPALSLGYRNNGTGGNKDHAQSVWDMRSSFMGHWAMSDVEHGYATPDAADSRMSNPAALAFCATRDMGELMYMRFISWPQGAGFVDKNAFNSQSKEIKKAMNTVFHPKKPYPVELWFLAPFKATDLRKNCLRFFTELQEHRYDFVGDWQDGRGKYFIDTKTEHPPSYFAKTGGTLFRVPVATGRKVLPTTAPARSRHSNTRHQAEQSTAENTHETEHIEDIIPTVVNDAKMSERSTSRSPGTLPTPETLAMLTFGAAPAPETARQQQTFDMPTSKQSRFSSAREDFVPSFMTVDLDEMDDNVSDSKADLDYGSNGDGVEEEDEDQGEGDGRPT